MSLSVKRRSQSGFTLVELLIVVAIIGVLSTIGVPTFRRMVQKAKKSEAKVNLGGIYTAENAFYSEYGLYGNNLERVGFEADGASTAIYTIGFFDNGCKSVTVAPASAADSNLASQLITAYPDYIVGTVTKAGNTKLTGCNDAATAAVPAVVGPPAVAAIPAAPCDVAPKGVEFNSFRACAVGPIAPGVLIGDSGRMDVWIMDNKRNIINSQDGVGR